MYDLLIIFVGALIGSTICLVSIVGDDKACERAALVTWRIVCAYTVASVLTGAVYAAQFLW
ncbi:hypothetical protein [Nocardia sp. MW-W600-9]